MDPIGVLKEFSKQNPKGATLLFGAVACFATVAAVVGFGLDFESTIPSVLIVIAVGVLLAVVTAIVNDRLIMTVLKWFLLAGVAVWIVVFLLSRFFPGSTALQCFVYVFQTCRTTADKMAGEVPPLPSTKAVPTTTVQFSDAGKYTVFVQFAGVIKREDVKVMMQDLANRGWNVQGTENGGERIAAAAGYNEIRYQSSDEAEAAEALANAVEAANLASSPIKTQLTPSLEANTLEVWISRS